MLSYRFENDEIVGEYSIDGPISPEDYLRDFFDQYGTEPRVVSVIVDAPIEVAEAQANARSATTLDAPAAEFDAPPVDYGKVDALLAEAREGVAAQRESSDVNAAAGQWKPTSAEIKVQRLGAGPPHPGGVKFSQFYSWFGGASTRNLGADDGFELEVNIRTHELNYWSGLRPACPAGYKDQPFAKNYGWTWEVLVNTGSGLKPAGTNIQAYADYNDFSDPCRQSSMAIGIRSPQNIPSHPNGIQEVLVNISANRGVDNVGTVGGVVQAVNEVGCRLNPLLSNTDCMGLTTSNAGERTTLNWNRNWWGPNLCWRSGSYGVNPSDPATQFAC